MSIGGKEKWMEHTLSFFCRVYCHSYNFPKLEESEKDDNVNTITLNSGQFMWENNCAEVLIICFPFLQLIENRFLHWQK